MPASEFSLITVTEDWLSELVELEAACFQDPWSKAALASEIGALGTEFVAAIEAGRLVGFCILKKILDEGEIYHIAVLPQKRRRGIGTGLMEAAIARSGDLSALHLEVRAGNGAAISLYEKLGFLQVGRRRGYYANPPEDAILMTRKGKNHAHTIH